MTTKTSKMDPIRVDWLPGGTRGAVGMTFAPGMKALSTGGFRWERDLEVDLADIKQVGGTVLLTLMEKFEFSKFGIPNLAERAEAAGLKWRHFPIVDREPPTSAEAVAALVAELIEWVDAGERIVIHCRGGLGRTGTIAAAYLVGRGMDAEAALKSVRTARQSDRCPEMETQRAFVRGFKFRPPARRTARQSASTPAAVHALVADLEQHIRSVGDQAFYEDSAGITHLVRGKESWVAGKFQTPSLGSLRSRLAAHPSAGKGKLELLRLTGSQSDLDIGRMQAAAAPRTLFQAASQFNCLEAPGPSVVPVANYFTDHTQGPRASISAFPGVFLRHYRCPRPAGGTFVQVEGDGLNLLADATGADSGVRNGYLRAQNVPDPSKLAALLTNNFEKLQVGIHSNVEVALGEDWYGAVKPPGQCINQVFTSTIDLNGSSGGRSADFQQIRTQLLRAAYLGTLYAALDLGDSRVVLTLIGGGVFGNPRAEIVAAIHWAVAEAQAVAPAPLQVLVNDFSGSAELSDLPAVAASAAFPD